MKKYIFLAISTILIFSLCSKLIEKDKNNMGDKYEVITLNQNLTEETKLIKVIDWFKNQVDEIDYSFKQSQKQNKVYITYNFIHNNKSIGNLQIVYKKYEIEYCDISLNMIINGTPKSYSGQEAVRMLLMFLNSNNDFDYYFM